MNTNDASRSIFRRSSRLGRWGPAVFYLAIVLSWWVNGLIAGATDFLWLALWSLPAIALYLWRVRKQR